MIFLLLEFRRVLCKPFLISLLAFSSSTIFSSVLYADVSLRIGAPRGFAPEESGVYKFDNSGGTVSVFATDTDEFSKEILSTSELLFDVTVGGAGKLTVQPHNFDAGDWAHAIAVFEDDVPLFFFQIRRAGSTAEVLDSSLASLAVSANLWTSTDDYFEFNPGHAGVALKALEQSGPASFYSFTIPEPSTIAMLCLAACCCPTRLMRRTI